MDAEKVERRAGGGLPERPKATPARFGAYLVLVSLILALGLLGAGILVAARSQTLLDRAFALLGAAAGAEAALIEGEFHRVLLIAGICVLLVLLSALTVGSACWDAMRRRIDEEIKRREEQTSRDELTGQLNARAILARLDEESLNARKTGKPFACVAVDIDGLAAVNDEFGHKDGDRVIKGIAAILRERLRNYDSVGRYAGGEFVLILPSIPEDRARAAVERLREAVAKGAGDRAGLDYIKLTAGFGLATGPAGEEAAAEILRRAEAALRADKAARGKARA